MPRIGPNASTSHGIQLPQCAFDGPLPQCLASVVGMGGHGTQSIADLLVKERMALGHEGGNGAYLTAPDSTDMKNTRSLVIRQSAQRPGHFFRPQHRRSEWPGVFR